MGLLGPINLIMHCLDILVNIWINFITKSASRFLEKIKLITSFRNSLGTHRCVYTNITHTYKLYKCLCMWECFLNIKSAWFRYSDWKICLMDWKLESVANSWKFLSEKLGLKSAVSRALKMHVCVWAQVSGHGWDHLFSALDSSICPLQVCSQSHTAVWPQLWLP